MISSDEKIDNSETLKTLNKPETEGPTIAPYQGGSKSTRL